MSDPDPFELCGDTWWVSANFTDTSLWGCGATKQEALDDLAKTVACFIAFDEADDAVEWWSDVNSTPDLDKDFEHG